MKKVLVLIVIVLVVLGIAYLAKGPGKAPVATETGPVTIGFTGPLTGDLANIGQNAKAAVEIAVSEVNAAGGINGRTLNVIYEDDKCAGPEGASAAQKLINIDKVSVILGSTCSPATLAMAPIAEQAKTVVLSYSATAPKISDAGDYIFRDVPSDLFQAKYAAQFAYNTLKKTKVAIVYINNDWGIGLNKAFTDAFTALGGSVVSSEAYAPDSQDLRSQITKVKASTADLFYFPSFTDGAIAGIKQAKVLGLKQPIFGADSWDDNKIWDTLGKDGEGVMYTRVKTNSTDAFKASMKAKLGNDSIIYPSNFAYDGIKILAQVISQVGTDSTKIKDALYKVNYNGGVSNLNIQFDKNGDPVGADYNVLVVKNAKAEVLQ
ncbi:MAG: ABC transporter substrate-binding protein [Candidatus Pacebacteria bacterium]|nr:ABC transporter substrate-binding protein [Candidatus Paceibacterota bacterium]MDD5357237.1 ABC transporter substrate-binding protein [Candidatus Paceibacterota bacterium]